MPSTRCYQSAPVPESVRRPGAAGSAASLLAIARSARLGRRPFLRQDSPIMAESNRLTFTDIEIRSYLPSGWGIRPQRASTWDAAKGTYEIEVYDPADNSWPLKVTGKDAAASGRLEALKASVDVLYRQALR
jgi:hypothetical protein